jgi:hypothetical protein
LRCAREKTDVVGQQLDKLQEELNGKELTVNLIFNTADYN